MMPLSRLLKSWMMWLVSSPSDSIFWAWISEDSSFFSADTSSMWMTTPFCSAVTG